MNDIIIIGMGMAVLAINCTTMILTFPGKRSLPFTVGALVLFSIAFYSSLYFLGIIVPDKGGLPGLAYLPIMLLLFKGKLFQKVFAYFLQFLLTSFQVALAEAIGGFFTRFGGEVSFIVFHATLAILLTTYIIIMLKVGRNIFNKLFIHGRHAEWALYSFGAIFAFAVMTTTQIAPGSPWHIVMMLFFILWSFVVLCFAIINANEKARHKYDAEFACDIISSGSDHYRRINEMYDTLRILRHDYKYHLDVIGELLSSGNKSETEKYLDDIQKQFPKSELLSYCSNPVLNSLLASYSERCAALNIKIDIEISTPENIVIPNYEMCIVIGNLLENAVEASCRHNGSRRIELIINTQGAHLAIMVKNNFCGEIKQDNGLPASAKKEGGLGLRSVQAVAARYGGELMTEWDDKTFSVYVLMKVKRN